MILLIGINLIIACFVIEELFVDDSYYMTGKLTVAEHIQGYFACVGLCLVTISVGHFVVTGILKYFI